MSSKNTKNEKNYRERMIEPFEAKNDPSEKYHLGRALRRASVFFFQRMVLV